MHDELERYLTKLDGLPARICEALRAEALRIGFSDDCLGDCRPETAAFRLTPDPVSGANTLAGEWRRPEGQRLGEIAVHADGSFFAEYDVVLPHPSRPKWFVEAITAWGNRDTVTAEPRLLPFPE